MQNNGIICVVKKNVPTRKCLYFTKKKKTQKKIMNKIKIMLSDSQDNLIYVSLCLKNT